MTNTANLIASVCALGFAVGICWREVGDFTKRAFFRLADRLKRAHLGQAVAGTGGPRHRKPAAAPKEETMTRESDVTAMLWRATKGATALAAKGNDCDDTELVADFIAAMDHSHQFFVKGVEQEFARLRGMGTPQDQLNDHETAMRLSMIQSPAGTNAWFLWRLATIIKNMASPDVVEAAREVVLARKPWTDPALRNGVGPCPSDHDVLDRAVAKLAAALPKGGLNGQDKD